MAKKESKLQMYEALRGQLEQERQSFIPHWRDLGDHILPRRVRFTPNDINKGDKRNQKIIDSTATLANRTLRSGMMSGITSPARPWFRLTTPDPELSEFGPVKEWLHIVAERIGTSFLRSNLYNVLPMVYGDLGTFGTAAMMIEEDFKDVLHCTSFPIGSYMVAKDHRGIVNVFFREFRMTVRQMVDQFGKRNKKTGKIEWDNFTDTVKDHWENNQKEMWIDVCHVIKPNDDYDKDRLDPKYKKFSSCYYEKSAPRDEDKFLRESGYDFFPVLVPRWEVTGEDVYGTDCPGMTALGDIKQLQISEKRAAQAIDKMVNPPLQGPSVLRQAKVSQVAGDITYHDAFMAGKAGLTPIYQTDFRLDVLEQKQDQVRNRIRRAFYEDLFLMLANTDRRQITAREIEERHDEKLLALGPVLEQLNQDLLDPMIDIAFEIHMSQGLIPPPPDELDGINLKVEYVSMMAQAQRLVGIGGTERFIGFAGQVAQFAPSVLDKIDADQVIDVMADITGVNPSIVRSDDKVAEIRQAKAQQEQQMQQAQMVQQSAGAARDLSQTDMEGDNALTRLLQTANAGALA